MRTTRAKVLSSGMNRVGLNSSKYLTREMVRSQARSETRVARGWNKVGDSLRAEMGKYPTSN